MYCRNCGQEIPDDSKFCPKCGYKIPLQANTATQKTPPITVFPSQPKAKPATAPTATTNYPDVSDRPDMVAKKYFGAESAEDFFWKSIQSSGGINTGGILFGGIFGGIGALVSCIIVFDALEHGNWGLALGIITGLLLLLGIILVTVFTFVEWPIRVALSPTALNAFSDEIGVANFLSNYFKKHEDFTYFTYMNGVLATENTSVFSALKLSGIEFMFRKFKGKIAFSRSSSSGGTLFCNIGHKKLIPFLTDALNCYYVIKTGVPRPIIKMPESKKSEQV